MAKILLNEQWYEEVDPEGQYEIVYEGLIKLHSERLWPRFYPVPFKASVYAGTDGVKADMALIERDYSEWWVVEIEMAHHSFEGHVFKQTRKLAEAEYGDDVAEKLCAGNSNLDLRKTKEMVEEMPPRVLVVVNRPCPEWTERLNNIGAMLAVFEVFKSDDENFIFRVNGEHPKGKVEIISICRVDELIPRFVVVSTPISLRGRFDEDISIEFGGRFTAWRRFEQSGKLWLYTPFGPNPLSSKCDYELLRLGDGRLSFRTA